MLVEQDKGYLLRVSVYDPSQSNEILDIGENGLIKVHSGFVNWNTQFEVEIGERVGKLLVSG
ncbi:hypothetical protein N7486_002101 [Penicillium sp. IBT 16267x]|nr:hypothetical protein N7486_002101 [Penicillium sp. IBT 16267x]